MAPDSAPVAATDVADATPKEGVVSAALVMAVPLVRVEGKSPAAMAPKEPTPATAVAWRTCVVVVSEAAPSM